MVKTAAGHAKESREPWQKLSKVAQTRNCGNKGTVGAVFVGDEEGDSEVP